MTETTHDSVYDAVLALFHEAAARFECAHVEFSPGPAAGSQLPKLSCSANGTTSITAMPGADQIDHYLGRDTWLELFPKRRSKETLVGRVKAIVDAVTTGRFEEIVWEKGGRITRSKWRITLADGSCLSGSEWRLRGPLFSGHKRSTAYLPYA